MESAINERAVIGGNLPPFDFFEFFDRIVDTIGMSSAEKLIQIILARRSHAVGGGPVSPSRSEVARQASCSEATFKRTHRMMEVFFDVNQRRGKSSEYTPKISVTADQVEAAIKGLSGTKGAHCEPGHGARGAHSEPGSPCAPAHPVGNSVSRGSPSRVLSEPGHKKEIPPTPPKEKNNIYNNNHHSIDTAREQVEVVGLNGTTHTLIERLAGWINPAMPDRVTARASLENLVKMYPPDIVRDGFAHIEAKILSGDIVPTPIKYLTATCRGMHAQQLKEAAKAAKPKIHRQPRPWD